MKYVIYPKTVLMKGIMHKKWLRKRRYFVLFADGLLYRYEKEGDTKYKDAFFTQQSVDLKAVSFRRNYPFGIELKMPGET